MYTVKPGLIHAEEDVVDDVFWSFCNSVIQTHEHKVVFSIRLENVSDGKK